MGDIVFIFLPFIIALIWDYIDKSEIFKNNKK